MLNAISVAIVNAMIETILNTTTITIETVKIAENRTAHLKNIYCTSTVLSKLRVTSP